MQLFHFRGMRLKRFPFGCVRDGRHFSRDSILEFGVRDCEKDKSLNRKKVQEHFFFVHTSPLRTHVDR
jgi:hypothetical protein